MNPALRHANGHGASSPRVLFVCHNHPDFHPGGTEVFAHDLYRTLRETGAAAPTFLACVDRLHRQPREGTAFHGIGRASDELVLWTGRCDRFFHAQIDLPEAVTELTALLQTLQPEVVHFHHTLLIGAEALFLVRRLLPESRIVLTLHDYSAICAHDGLMITTADRQLCTSASLDACHRCFPERGLDQFRLREKHLKSMFAVVDRFVAPSRFLRQRYIDWGIDPARIDVIANGRPPVAAAAPRAAGPDGRRAVFGYFGNVTPFKGVLLALTAAQRLAQEGVDHALRIHGSAQYQEEPFRQQLAAALAATPTASHHGAYAPEALASLMAKVDWVVVPSIWWENAPLVIAEARQHRRPVICADIGGMAEAVRDGIDGLHFEAGSAASLARTMRCAAEDGALWEQLAGGAPAAPTIAESAAAHLRLYRELLAPQPSVSPDAAAVDAGAPRRRRSRPRSNVVPLVQQT